MRYVAFLRGINLGRRRVTGEDLEGAFRAAGVEHPASYQAAGNVVFDDRRAAVELSEHLESVVGSELGFRVRLILRTADQTRELAAAVPFTRAELDGAGKVQAIMVGEPLGPGAAREALQLAPAGEILRWGDRVMWWLPAAGVSDSQIDLGAVDRLLGLTTTRTKGTIERLAKKYLSHTD